MTGFRLYSHLFSSVRPLHNRWHACLLVWRFFLDNKKLKSRVGGKLSERPVKPSVFVCCNFIVLWLLKWASCGEPRANLVQQPFPPSHSIHFILVRLLTPGDSVTTSTASSVCHCFVLRILFKCLQNASARLYCPLSTPIFLFAFPSFLASLLTEIEMYSVQMAKCIIEISAAQTCRKCVQIKM